MSRSRCLAVSGLVAAVSAVTVSLGSGSALQGPGAIQSFQVILLVLAILSPSCLVIALLFRDPRTRVWAASIVVGLVAAYWLSFLPGLLLSRYQLRSQREAMASAITAFSEKHSRPPKDLKELYGSATRPTWAGEHVKYGVGLWDRWTHWFWYYENSGQSLAIEPRARSLTTFDNAWGYVISNKPEISVGLLAIVNSTLVLILGNRRDRVGAVVPKPEVPVDPIEGA